MFVTIAENISALNRLIKSVFIPPPPLHPLGAGLALWNRNDQPMQHSIYREKCQTDAHILMRAKLIAAAASIVVAVAVLLLWLFQSIAIGSFGDGGDGATAAALSGTAIDSDFTVTIDRTKIPTCWGSNFSIFRNMDKREQLQRIGIQTKPNRTKQKLNSEKAASMHGFSTNSICSENEKKRIRRVLCALKTTECTYSALLLNWQ